MVGEILTFWTACASIPPMNRELQDQKTSLQTKQLPNARAETSFPAVQVEAMARFCKCKSFLCLSFSRSWNTSFLDVKICRIAHKWVIISLFLITSAKLKPLELDRKKNTSESFLALVVSYIEARHVGVR